jgi:hypothetical protein
MGLVRGLGLRYSACAQALSAEAGLGDQVSQGKLGLLVYVYSWSVRPCLFRIVSDYNLI